MIPFGPKVKLAGLALVIAAIGYSGWTARGWFEDSKDLAAMEAQHALAEEIREGQAQVSKQVADHLSQLEGTERIIDRGIIREVSKPIYQRVCLPDPAIRLLNAAAQGQDPGELESEVPGEPATTE